MPHNVQKLCARLASPSTNDLQTASAGLYDNTHDAARALKIDGIISAEQFKSFIKTGELLLSASQVQAIHERANTVKGRGAITIGGVSFQGVCTITKGPGDGALGPLAITLKDLARLVVDDDEDDVADQVTKWSRNLSTKQRNLLEGLRVGDNDDRTYAANGLIDTLVSINKLSPEAASHVKAELSKNATAAETAAEQPRTAAGSR